MHHIKSNLRCTGTKTTDILIASRTKITTWTGYIKEMSVPDSGYEIKGMICPNCKAELDITIKSLALLNEEEKEEEKELLSKYSIWQTRGKKILIFGGLLVIISYALVLLLLPFRRVPKMSSFFVPR